MKKLIQHDDIQTPPTMIMKSLVPAGLPATPRNGLDEEFPLMNVVPGRVVALSLPDAPPKPELIKAARSPATDAASVFATAPESALLSLAEPSGANGIPCAMLSGFPAAICVRLPTTPLDPTLVSVCVMIVGSQG